MFQSLNDLYQRCNCSKTISGPDIEIYLLPGPAARAVHRASLVTVTVAGSAGVEKVGTLAPYGGR